MKTTSDATTDIPTALPGVEADDEREKLLLEDQSEDFAGDPDPESSDAEASSPRQRSRTAKILKSIAGFSIFVFVMGSAITWFFGMGWFTTPKPQPVSRGGQTDIKSAPVTEEEKLKAALTMVASKEPNLTHDSAANLADEITVDKPEKKEGQTKDMLTMTNAPATREPSAAIGGTNIQDPEKAIEQNAAPNPRSKEIEARVKDLPPQQSDAPIEPLGRSIFFGISKVSSDKPGIRETKPSSKTVESPITKSPGQLPFGTLLPVRLIGAVYTLRNSGGVVRMELTQPIQGKGYSYPAGTTIIGNLRSGESTRAFVTIVGLIDPVSGGLTKFAGELVGSDGSSGIIGNRKRITGKWTRFFNGLKDTTGSILGSVGSLRSGGTVILSEPLSRGSEKISENASQALLGGDKDDTFLEVLAGTTGYVLVTELPEARSVNTVAARAGADKE